MTGRLFGAIAVLVVAGCGSVAPASETPASEVPASSPVTASESPAAVDPAGPFTASIPPTVTTVVDQALTVPTDCGTGPCVVPVDIVAPIEADGVPTVVLIPGGPVPFEGRRYLEDLAVGLAERGAVAYISVYRSGETGNAEGDTLEDIRCAIRFARATTANYGGDPDRLVLVGHSYGAYFTLRTALASEVESPSCVEDGDGIPNAAVALAGFDVQLAGAEPTAPPMLLVSGSDDPEAERGEPTAERLLEAGYDATYTELTGIDHGEIVYPVEAPEVVDLILDAVP